MPWLIRDPGDLHVTSLSLSLFFSGGRGMRHHVYLPLFPKVLRLEA